ncbi:MAG: RecQ family zinc-binding domain-containing protein, partial [Gemmatimonadetes bacterium]|nr:RecQ family zinc-binding domain-containing protein [Gemmatimonadota bacterium]
LARMEAYARARRCRRVEIAAYFGEGSPRCTGCDRCG